jgi:Leucine-rich repeat (LRR) protein
MPSRLTVVIVSLLLATPAVIFWLWLVIQPTSVANQCPEECECKVEGCFVNCSNSALHNIPLNIPTHVRILVLSGNNITYLENDSFVFKGLFELLTLKADLCKIRKIELGAFNGLTSLMFLSLSGNEIREIKPGTFKMTRSLVHLYLPSNRIEHLENDLFYGLVNLKFIRLSGNKLHNLHPDIFVRSRKLQGIYLSHNAELSIPTDRHFINSRSLKHLGIEGCNVRSVSVETFSNISALERLDMGYNHLMALNISILKSLPRLSTLYLYGNPLQCDCQLQEVWRWCQDHNIQTAYKEMVPICDTPSEVKGMWWGVLEKGQCLQGNVQYYGDYKDTSYVCTLSEDMDKDTMPTFFTETSVRLKHNISKLAERYPHTVSVFIFIFGTTGNVILIIIVICNKGMRTVPNLYILNLALSDIIYLMALFLEGLRMRKIITWLSGEIACTIFVFFYRMSVSLTAYSVAVLSIQRYRVTVNPLHVRVSSQPAWRGTGAIICCVWIVAALFAIPEARSRYLCDRYALIWLTNCFQQYLLFQLLVCCVLPLFAIAFSYIMTARHLVKPSCSVSEETQNSQMNSRKKSAKIVLALTAVFVISYVPFHISHNYLFSKLKYENLLTNWSDENDWLVDTIETNIILKYFLPINSCLNPVAIFCTSRAFRRHFKRYLTCCCNTKSPPNDLELTTRN